jgi:hypothetical protein
MVILPVGSRSRSRLMGSCLKDMSGCDHGVGPGSGSMGDVDVAKPVLKAVTAVGP